MIAVLFVATLVLLVVIVVGWQRQVVLKRESYIRTFELPNGLFAKLRQRRPELSLKDCQLVAHALRQFFLAYLKGGRRFVSMPSQVVDDLWHEYILYTRNYQSFCDRAFGRFLHHTPAVALGADRENNAGLRRVWYQCCIEDNINPRKPSRLPLLFAIDSKLAIADGFRYVPDCSGVRRADGNAAAGANCGGDFSSSSIDGSTDGFGDSGSGDGGSSGGGGSSGDSGGGDGGGGSGCGGGGCGS